MSNVTGWHCDKCHNLKSIIEPTNDTVCGFIIDGYTDEKLIDAYHLEYPIGMATNIGDISYETTIFLIAKYNLYKRKCMCTSYHFKGDVDDVDKNRLERTLHDIYNDVKMNIDG